MTFRHFNEISFILLDWNLLPEDITSSTLDGIILPQTARDSLIEENIAFLTKMKEVCFAPIFIFTNEDKNEVINVLKHAGLYQDDKPNYILVKNKKELIGRTKLFKEIQRWALKTPSIYVLKKWEKQYKTAKNSLFHDLYDSSSNWPKILWDSFAEDGVNMSLELGEIITRNLYTRMSPFSFDESALKKRGAKFQDDEVLRVLEGERFMKMLDPNDIGTGDLFYGKINDNNPDEQEAYWLNIRAQCDLVHSNKPNGIELYCLKGKPRSKSDVNKKNGIPFIEGQFIEKVNNAIVGCLDNGKIIEFSFRDLKPVKWGQMKNKRIGRLLSPYITRIQERYALYLKRQGLSRTPEIVILDNTRCN